MDLRKFIEPTKLDNTDKNGNTGNTEFETEDMVYVDSVDEACDIHENDISFTDGVDFDEDAGEFCNFIFATDYAIMNNLNTYLKFKHKMCSNTWLRSAPITGRDNNDIDYINEYGEIENCLVENNDAGICPALHLNLTNVMLAQNKSRDLFKISKISSEEIDDYHIIEFGEYPKTYVGNVKNKELERLYSFRKLTSTGKKYTGRINNNGKLITHPEFEYKGQKYVRVLTKVCGDDRSKYSDGTNTLKYNKTYMWTKVEPIVWIIRNWDELPKVINPNGSGKAKYIDIKTDEAIMSGIPFYPNIKDKNCNMWQNSTIRGYLNGINVNNIKTNGNTKFTAPNGGNFIGKNNFLTEAFNIEIIKTSKATNENKTKAIKSKLQSTDKNNHEDRSNEIINEDELTM